MFLAVFLARRLTDQTAIATQDIQQVVAEMQASVSTGVMEMDKFTDEVRRGVETVSTRSGRLARIIDQVRIHGPQFTAVKDGMYGQSQGAQQLSEAIGGLQSEVSRFKISS